MKNFEDPLTHSSQNRRTINMFRERIDKNPQAVAAMLKFLIQRDLPK